MSQSKKVVSNKSCKKALARGKSLAPPATKLKESRKTREVSRSYARDNKNYYSVLVDEEEELETQAALITKEKHGINTSWFNRAPYVLKKVTVNHADDYEQLHLEEVEYFASRNLCTEFCQLEEYGPWRQAMLLGTSWKREEFETKSRDLYERTSLAQEKIKRVEISRFRTLRELEIRALDFSEACWIEAHLVGYGTYAEADQLVTNLVDDYYGRYKGRRFDPEIEKYDREDISQYLGFYGHRYFYNLPKRLRKRLILRNRKRIKQAMDRLAFIDAYHWNNDWVEDDVLSCMHLLFEQPQLMSVQGKEEDDKILLEGLSSRDRKRFLEDAYGNFAGTPEEEVEAYEQEARAEASSGKALMDSFKDALTTLSGHTRQFVVRALDVVSALYNLSQATTKVSFMSLLYSAIRTIFKDLDPSRVLDFGKSLMTKLQVQAGSAEVWRYIANALSVMWEGAGNWIACPMVDVVLDIINLLAFTGLLPQSTVDLLDDPKYNVFSRKVKRAVCGIPDMIGIVIRACMLAAEVVATYCENGVLDLYGWACGSKKEVFSDHAALMAEHVEAKLGLLKSDRRSDKARFHCPAAYAQTLDKTIDTCTYEMRKSKGIGEKQVYARMLKELMGVRNELTMALRCREARIKPFTFSVYGATSSMKSTVATATWKAIAQENGLEHSSTNFCTVNFKDEYFSEVHQQEILIMDDFMNEKDTSAQKVNPIRILLDWSSNNTVQIPGAAIHEKGNKFCRAKVLGLTCHDREFHAHTMSYQPEAAYRRIELYIECVMDPTVRSPDGQPNFSAINERDGPDACFPDIWFFNCYKCHIQGTGFSWLRVGKPLMDNDELETLVRQMSREHFRVQESIVAKLNNAEGWFCPHNRLTGACKLCKAKDLEAQAEMFFHGDEMEEEKLVDVNSIRRVMHAAIGSQSECLTATLFSELMEFKDLASLRARVNRCAGECIQPVIEDDDPTGDFTVDVVEFLRLFRDPTLLVDGPELPELPCDLVREARGVKDMGVQAQLFEMHDGLFYETVTWEELELMYCDGSREEIVGAHQRVLERFYDCPDLFVSVSADTYHYEVVFTIVRTSLNCQGEEVETDKPAGTYKKEVIREQLRKSYLDAYGPMKDNNCLTRFRRRATQKQILMTAEGAHGPVHYSWFFWQIFSSMKYVIASVVFLGLMGPGALAACYSAYMFYRNCRWRQVWRVPFVLCSSLCYEFRGVGRFFSWGSVLSDWLDEQWMPAKTRYSMAVKRAYDESGTVGAAAAIVSMRCRPVTALDIRFGRSRALVIKSVLNVAGYVAAATAAFALYKAFAALRPMNFVGSAAKKPVTETVAVASSVEGVMKDYPWGLQQDPALTKEQVWTRWINKLVDDATIQDEHFYHIPKDRVKEVQELTVNSSEIDYPELLAGEHHGGWAKLNPSPDHIGAQAKTTKPAVLRDRLDSNLRFAVVTGVGDGKRKSFRVHALAVCGNDWLIPSHVFTEGIDDYEFLALVDKPDVAAPHIKGTFCRKYICELEGVDFSLVRIPGSTLMKDIRMFFPSGEMAGSFAQLVHRVEQQLTYSNSIRLPPTTFQSVQSRGAHYKNMKVCMLKQYPVITYQGLCGAVWMGGAETKPFIHSLHICGLEGEAVGGSCVVRGQDVDAARLILDLSVMPVASAGDFPLQIQAQEWEHKLNPRHFLNYIPLIEGELPIVNLVGTHSGHSGKYSQDIRDSLIAPALRERLEWPVVHQPVPHPNSSRHFQHAMVELAYPRNDFVASIMDKAVMDFTSKILDHVRDIPLLHDMIRPLPDTAVVSGIDSMVGVDKMNPSTSAGFPERGKKGRFFVGGDEDAPVSVPMTLDAYHLGLAREMEEKLANGVRVYAPFTLSVKIEPVKLTKEFARLFGASNMVFTFVFRKYFLSIFRLIQMQPFHFETALGINCHSSDWDEMTQFVEHHDRLIEGDYQTYDKTMGASIILHSFSVLIAIAKEAGYTERQLTIMRGIATEVAFPTYEARGVLFVAGGSNPSGHPGTFIINCFANSLFMRYAFYWGMKQHGVPMDVEFPKRFDDLVKLVTAGDDHLAGVHPDCFWFDQFVMQKAMTSIRVGYTDGKKNPTFDHPFTTIQEASFVSRGFRKCDYLERWVAPLAIKSLQKSYMIHNFGDKCPYTPAELIAIVVEQNETELFFHGKEQFEYYYYAVRGAIDDAGLSTWQTPVKSWEEVGELIRERSKPAFYPNLTTQAQLVETDEPPSKRLRTTVDNFLVATCVNGKLYVHLENAYGEITRGRPGVAAPPCIHGYKFTTTTGSLSRLHGYIGKLLASQNNSNNGMTSSANVVHDNPGALTWSSSRGAAPDASRELYSGSSDGLNSYLERPVLLAQLEWGIGSNPQTRLYPLERILDAPPILRKLQNFQNIIFELEIDFEVSANPFLYGMLLINWVPFPKYDALLRDRGLIFADNVEASQRQRLFIDASGSTGGTMRIPFYWPTEYFNLVKDEPRDFGYLSVRQLNPLMHVSGVNQQVTVYVRAKMVNIKLHTSTTQLVGAQPTMSVQAKDESPDDKLSSIATRVASTAKTLTPIFGGYAIATEQAASTAAGVLRAMGLSHPRSKEMVHRMENRPLGNMSNFNTPSSAYTLGLDEHNEVSIDAGIASMSEDEMSLPYILGKETLIGTYDWDITNLVDSTLAVHRVHPYQFLRIESPYEMHCTPMAYLARMFTFWTGSIKFRFQIVCSKWHRGRLRIIHDPVLMDTVDANMWQTNLQSIVDITEERDFEIEVKYVQGQLWSKTGAFRSSPDPFLINGQAYTIPHLVDANGVIKLVVMNRLVIPDDTVSAPCHINVYASAGGDFELAVPKDNLSNFSITPPAVVQAQAFTNAMPETAMVVTAGISSNVYDPALNRMVTNLSMNNGADGFSVPFYATQGTVQSGSVTLQNMSAGALTVSATTNGFASIVTIPAGGTGDVIVKSSSATATGPVDVSGTIGHNGTGSQSFRVVGASLPTLPGFVWKSAVDEYRVLQRDGQQDATGNPTPPPTWPVYFNLGGAPTVYWRTTGATQLYGPGNYGVPVRVLSFGPVRVNDGIYGPTRVSLNQGTIRTNTVAVDQGTGYSNATFQLSADFAASTTVRGVVYDVMFLQPALVTQAEEMQDPEVGDPNEPPTQASMHDASTPDVYAHVYFGEKILHLRQILGRPQYHTTYSLVSGAASTVRKNRIVETNIPEYPLDNFICCYSPLYFLMACYNGWRGSFRSKYVINGTPANMPALARLERMNVGENARSSTYTEFPLNTVNGISSLVASNTSMWNGAIITNPQLANEINAEFPYYYRHRFRNARPARMGGRASATDTHSITVDMLSGTGPNYMDRYFQPGDDFTLMNWMGTPILY